MQSVFQVSCRLLKKWQSFLSTKKWTVCCYNGRGDKVYCLVHQRDDERTAETFEAAWWLNAFRLKNKQFGAIWKTQRMLLPMEWRCEGTLTNGTSTCTARKKNAERETDHVGVLLLNHGRLWAMDLICIDEVYSSLLKVSLMLKSVLLFILMMFSFSYFV